MRGFSLLLAGCTLVLGEVVKFTLDITKGIIAPDNFAVPGLLINGNFTGPMMKVNEGDTLKVKVINNLKTNLSIHFHGIHQKDSQEMDGVMHVTQEPILPGGNFVYKFQIKNQAGTYWYHAHSGLDVENVYGPLIVNERRTEEHIKKDLNLPYVRDKTIMVSEFWHRDVDDMFKGLLEAPIRFTGEIDSILLNGRSYRNWEGNNNNKSVAGNNGFYSMKANPNQMIRLRVIAALGRNVVRFRIKNHRFTLVEVDGTLINPKEVDYIDLNGGQRFSAILTTSSTPGDYHIIAQSYSGKIRGGLGLLRVMEPGKVQDKLDNFQVLPLPTGKITLGKWVEPELKTSPFYKSNPIHHYYPVPKRVRRTFTLNNTKVYENGALFFLINGKKFSLDQNSVLLNKVLADEHVKDSIRNMDANELDSVQIVIQATVKKGGECDPHPWHLHGYSFYVVGHGEGIYNPARDDANINAALEKDDLPILRDTFTMYPPGLLPVTPNVDPTQPTPKFDDHPDFDSCGWYALRLFATNPGSWLMHCHTTAHMVGGMQTIFNVAPRPKSVILV